MGALPPLAARRLYHLKGNMFGDLQTGERFEIWFDNNTCIKDETEYYIMVDEMNYIINAVPV
jgi:hypothetical protein